MPILTAIVPSLISSVPGWVAEHYMDIPLFVNKAKELVGEAFTQGGLAITRIGNTIIWNRPDGAPHVIGLLDQLGHRLDGLEIAQHGLQTGLSGLKSLSMVTLGFSGVSAALIASQFVFLTRRLNAMQKSLGRIEVRIDRTIEAQLEAGLNFLQAADVATGEKRLPNYHDALGRARDAGHFFRGQAIDPNIHQEQLPLIQFYARKYFLALSIEIGSLVGLDQPDELKTRLKAEEAHLKTVASQVFKHTLAKGVESYLAPEMRDVATLENVSSIFEQAQYLGCIPSDPKITPAGVFEANRKNIYSGGLRRMVKPAFDSARKAAAQKLQTAHGTFEEITRLLSWRETVDYLTQNGRSPTEVASELRHFRDTHGTSTDTPPFVAYSVTPNVA